MTTSTIARRAPRVHFPSFHLTLPHRKARSFEDAIAELGAIDPRIASELVAIARHQNV